jgi:hypothetical protein
MILHAGLPHRVIVDPRLEMIGPRLAVVRLQRSDVGHPVLGDAILDLPLEGGKVIHIQKIGGDLKALTVEIRRKGDGACGLSFSK